ncbi:hypothetical protein [Variovorax sp. PvP013]|uniref:hypothetical protein n=1 Tax=Variovorax sp. PvP013 TaxID=3156435 RepID=UPI003D230045
MKTAQRESERHAFDLRIKNFLGRSAKQTSPNWPAMGSQFGHVAIDGVIYSRAHSKYARILDGASYRQSNLKIRDFEGLVLRVSQTEKTKIENELQRRVEIDAPYSIVNNSCSTNIADVLESIGILSHDPRFKMDPKSTDLVSPKEILIVVSRSKRMTKRNHYSKSP